MIEKSMEKLAGRQSTWRERLATIFQDWADYLNGWEPKGKSGHLLDFKVSRTAMLGRMIVDVESRRGGFVVGQIKWSNQWGKAAFKPDPESVFDIRCIAEIYAAMKDYR